MEGDAPRRTWPLKATLVVLTAGLYFAGYLAYLKLKITFPDPDFVSFCKLGDGFDCDEVQRHASSMLFGVPIALLAIPTYLVMGWLAWIPGCTPPSPPRAPGAQARHPMSLES